MIYVYPRFRPGIDLGFVRLGGSGLGNLLMFYAKAIVYAHEHDCKIIQPTWPSLKIGPYIRRERDKRFYGDLFRKDSSEISGLKKFKLLLFSRKINESQAHNAKDNDVIIFDKFPASMAEADLLGKSDIIYAHLLKVTPPRIQHSLNNSIALHVRLGDFSRGTESELKNGAGNSSTPVYWYADTLNKIRNALGRNIEACIFSDGTDEELAPLLKLDNCHRIFCGNALNDILTMSTAPLLIASCSTFSNWARFLGNMNAVFFPGQLRERFLTGDDSKFEIELDSNEELSVDAAMKLRELYL